MKKYLFLLSLCGLVFTSCGPLVADPYDAQLPTEPLEVKKVDKPASEYVKPTQTVSSQTQKQIRKTQEIPPYSSTTPTISAPKPPVVKTYPVAAPIPNKSGWVYNPYNNNPVFVEGIAAGKIVRDPKDPNLEHKFRVP